MYISLLFALLFLPTESQVEITPITHGSVVLTWQNKTIYVDPWSQGNYENIPPADLILITDIHADHLDPEQIAKVRKPGTRIIAPAAVQKTVTDAQILNNGETTEVIGIRIEAIPMYNLQRGPQPGQLYHKIGRAHV